MDDFDYLQLMMSIFNDVRDGKLFEQSAVPVSRAQYVYALMHDKAISSETFHSVILDIIESKE